MRMKNYFEKEPAVQVQGHWPMSPSVLLSPLRTGLRVTMTSRSEAALLGGVTRTDDMYIPESCE
jgi:hypothetical protein